ncbi:MAG: CHY zinc finger protein [Cyclobacteriaceae bacterium]
MEEKDIVIQGKLLDDQTRCVHYHSNLDVVAIKFKCCDSWYACYACHEELAGHAAVPWSLGDYDEPAVQCGVCKHLMRINQYLTCNNTCPQCSTAFNPKCANHYPLYFGSLT